MKHLTHYESSKATVGKSKLKRTPNAQLLKVEQNVKHLSQKGKAGLRRYNQLLSHTANA